MAFIIQVSFLAAAVAAVALGDRAVSPRLPSLQITTDRLSYRLTRENDYYVVRLTVTLRNPTPDTVFLAGECGIQDLPVREFVDDDGIVHSRRNQNSKSSRLSASPL